MSNQQSIECSHAACHCTIQAVVDTEAFCNDYCKAAEDSEEMDFCECGHPQCDVE